MRKLDRNQSSRLAEIIRELLAPESVNRGLSTVLVKHHSTRSIAEKVGLSFGYIDEIANGTREIIAESNALLICKGLGINPFYILERREPEYMDWKNAFYGRRYHREAS